MRTVRNLPIGIQDFQDIRKKGFVYIDKSELIWKLVHSGKPFFLSRPRRFGKSLLLSTIKAYFIGRKELFKGLAMEKLEAGLEEPWQEHPVFHFDFNGERYSCLSDLEQFISSQLEVFESDYGLESSGKSLAVRFSALLKRAFDKTGRQVVVLVDEYDKALLQTQGVNPSLNEEYRAMLKGFYGVLKSSDPYLRFVLLAGVSQFSRLSIFSDMNQFINITTDDAYAEICGITEEELKANLKPELENFAVKNRMNMENTLAALRNQYDGYKFARKAQHVYNPYSLLNALQKEYLENYWYETGTPTFLINLINRENFDPRNLELTHPISVETLKNSEADSDNPVPLLFQTGYLTLKEYNPRFRGFKLGFPNSEVRYAFLENLLPKYLNRKKDSTFFVYEFVRDVEEGKVDEFMGRIQSILAGLPYSLEKKSSIKLRERDYQIAVYLIFTLMGQYCRAEVHGLKGRADCIVELEDRVYIFEFKLMSSGTAKDAIGQIKEQGYAEPYKAEGKDIVLVGASFDEDSRNIGQWETEGLL